MAITPDVLTKVAPYPKRNNGPAVTRLMTVAASQTLYTGDFVKQTSSADTVEQALALPGSNSSATTSTSGQLVLGVVVGDGIATNSSGVEAATGRTQVLIALCDPNTDYLTRIFNTTASAAEQQDVQEYAVNYCLARYRAASATDWFYVLSTTTTNGILNITQKSPESASTDDYGLVRFRPTSSGVYNVA